MNDSRSRSHRDRNNSAQEPATGSRPSDGAAAAPPDALPPGQQPTGAQSSSEVEQLRAELAAAQDRALRTQAELENFRKRMLRDVEQDLRYAMLPLLRDLLSVQDNLLRAMQAAEQKPNSSGLLEGVKMVSAQLDEVLRRHHCRRIESEGVAFDPHLHEALAQQPSDQYPPNTVLKEVRAGYSLHDRVVRPAQVLVSTPPSDEEPESD